jgi:hypothetical protein
MVAIAGATEEVAFFSLLWPRRAFYEKEEPSFAWTHE